MAIILIILLTILAALAQWLAVYLNLPTIVNPAILLGIILISGAVAGHTIKSKIIPTITGFVLYGVLIGPHALKLITSDTIRSLDFIHFLSLFFIAFLAGGRLNIREHKNFYSLVPVISLAQLTSTIILTGLVMWIFSKNILLRTGSPVSTTMIIITGLILASNSTAAILAISLENQPRKHYKDFLLATSLTTNIIVMIFFVGKAVLFHNYDQTSYALSAGSVILQMTVHFVSAVLTGVILGFLFVFILSRFRREFLFFILLISIGAYVTAYNYLPESLIAFITAGIILRNFSRQGNYFMKNLENYSFPLFIVYFTITGAGLNLSLPNLLIPLLIVLFLIRLITLSSATNLALRLSGENRKTATGMSLAFLPQSGLTVGLLSSLTLFQESLITRELYAVLMWITFLNLLVGPPVLKHVMSKLKTLRNA